MLTTLPNQKREERKGGNGMRRYVLSLKNEQLGVLNDLIRTLGNQEKAELTLGNLRATGRWFFHEKDYRKDKLIVELYGLTRLEPPRRPTEPRTLSDGETVIVGEIELNPKES